MTTKLLAFILSFVLHPLPTHAAFEFHPIGAHTAGAGDVGVALSTGASGAFWNPAALAWGEPFSFFGAYDRPFGISELTTQALGIAVRKNRHGLGTQYVGFGFSLYREQILSLTYGLRLTQRAGLGISVRVLQLSVAGYPARQWAIFDLGVRIRLRSGFYLGAVAWNAGGVRTALLGQGGSLGVAVSITPQTTVVADVQKEATFATGAGIGLVFRAHPTLVLRTGAGSRPERLTAGFGVHKGHFTIDYAAVWHTVLGLSHRVSIRITH